MYTLKEIQASHLNNSGSEDLKRAGNWCWEYICKYSDHMTGLRYLYILWEAAYYHVFNNTIYFRNNTIPL